MKRTLTAMAIALTLLGCSLFSAEDQEPEDPFEPVFTAQINGKPFEGSSFRGRAGAIAIISTRGANTHLTITGTEWSEKLFPYNGDISISMLYENGKQKYSTQTDYFTDIDGHPKSIGGTYYENDGDARISVYEAYNDDEGFITVHVEEQDDGRTVVSGTFEMRLIVDSRADPYSQWADQDTLYITNGEYRVSLFDYDQWNGQE
ncbi:MAG: hypothetical protein FH748_00190 [Balneolaceae bacterium]|nr:hypothetical protein [Balneolaceae bacterium]